MGAIFDSGIRLANKAAAQGSVAVFVVAGKVKSVGGSNKDFESTVDRGIHRLLGIYDDKCPQEWMDDDLLWAEKHMAAA